MPSRADLPEGIATDAVLMWLKWLAIEHDIPDEMLELLTAAMENAMQTFREYGMSEQEILDMVFREGKPHEPN